MDKITKKTLDVSRGLTYTYYTSPAKAGKPTVLLLHGFPDEAAEWADVINSHLVPAGYGVIAPDCLGYGGTAKPRDPTAYKFPLMIRDITDILDAEKVDKVISIGHDWGSNFAQRVYNLAPTRVSGLVMMNVAYAPPTGKPFDLDGVLALTEKVFGYAPFWYWKLFTADDGAAVLDSHISGVFDLAHSDPPEHQLETFCKPDGLRNFLVSDGKVAVQAYATEDMRQRFIERMGRDGFTAPLCWYRALTFGHQDNEVSPDSALVNVPALFIGYDKDFVCRKELIGPPEQAGLLPQLTKIELEGSHWGFLDKTKEFGEALVGWLDKTYSS
ncbi:hypothetical protein AAFC00_001881 [Neodothiora populina]|uniref:AB hydrolase-1 domain-containing protein n=1 Tax=Neodothiora populina TaxID=2781224 RepID=A0ABR3PRJ3_9PEZI